MDRCDKCGREIGDATWDFQSEEEYKDVLDMCGYETLCETCTFNIKMELEHSIRKRIRK